MKKKYMLVPIMLGLFSLAIAQVAIGKENVEGSALLDFALDSNRGIILPTTNEFNQEQGSLALNRVDAKVYYIDTNLEEVALTGFESVDPSVLKDEKLTDNVEALQGVIIGSIESAASGVLILESLDKALVLPKVESPELNMPSPEPGTICYDTNSQSVALFDGTNWYFWNH